MATTTPNYGWAVPTSTDLVKDGATAIETLGDAIDASMNTALGTKKAGMVLLNTTSFSAVSAVNFTSNFSATYDNYRLVYSLTLASAADVFTRLRSGSTDATGSDYVTQAVTAATTVTNGRATNPYWYCNNFATATEFSAVYDLFNPFKAQVTNGLWQQYATTGATIFWNASSTRHNLTNSYDGLTIYSAQNMTGSASLYGYNK
jgi:hypothetical protein